MLAHMLAQTGERPGWPVERRMHRDIARSADRAVVDRAHDAVGDSERPADRAAVDRAHDAVGDSERPADRAVVDRAHDAVGDDPDRAAVDEARAGNVSAFETLVMRYQTRIVNYAAAMVHDQGIAEDVAQETFVRAWRGLDRFRAESSFKTWLYRIASNVARTCLDRRGRQARVGDRSLDDDAERLQAGDVPSAAPDAETALVTRETIDRALAELPEELRLALVLRDVEGLDYKEIAVVTRAPIGTVESRIFRARRRLKGLLRPLPRAPRAAAASAVRSTRRE